MLAPLVNPNQLELATMVIRQRGGIVSTITRIEGLVNGLTEAEVPLLGTREVLESQLRLVGQMRNKFLVLQTSIITDQTDETRKRTEVDYQKEILDRCDALTLNITSMLQQAPQDSAGESKSDLCNFMRDIMQQNQKCMMDLVNALSQNQSSGPSSGQAPSQNPPTVTKLPQIQLPTFDGKYSDWLSFRDRFQSSVIDHPSLSAVQKLDYLKSALTSDAASTIKHLSTTATNFSIAWDLLVQRFERKGEIVADHIRSLYSIPRVTSSDSQAIHKIYNTLSESVMALDAMEIPGRDPWIVQFVLDKLDTESRVLWGRECGNDVPSLSTFKKFLMQRCIDAKNSTESSATKNTNPNPKNQSYHKPNVSKRQIGVTQSDAAKPNCRCCSEAPHPLYRCAKFLGMSAFERFDVVKRLGLCRNCLDPHMTNSCTFRVCRKCQGKHNVLLHDKFASDSNSTVPPTPTTPPAPTTQNASGPPLQNSTSLVGVASTQRTRVYLMTAMVDALDVNGGRIPCRLLLDGGAEVNIITTELAQKLKLPRCQSNVAVVGVGGHQTKIRHQITATICSQISNDTFTFDCQVMPKATGNIPGWTTDKTQYNIPQHVTLADPLWADQKPIDIIVGGDVYWFSLLTNVISLGPGMPHLRETVFGYAIVGEQHSVPANRGAVCLATTSTLDDALEKFWKLEDLPDDAPITNEQQAAEDHFVATHTRTPEGRFVVELPFKKSPELLGESRPQAIRQLLALERKFEKFPELKKAYSEVMRDQEFPLASKALKKWFYVDDCVVSCKSIEEAREIQSQLINVLGRGDFTLAKWTSNHKGLFEPNADSQDSPPENPIISVLGLHWNTETDSFVFTSPLDDTKEVKTKRNMASAIAKLFDPIGLIGPVVIEAKIMLQELHKLKIPWDGKLPQDIIEKWLKFAQGLQHLPELKIPRWISCFECPVTTVLHIFCDASINAYGVAIYIVTSDAKNNKHSSLYLAKSRVAPLQKLTIPKLELEAAKVAICTYDKFKNTCNADSTYFWSDSTTVLSWLRSPPDDFKVFVANRVRRILQSSEPDQWHHVPGKCNPADIISRGASPAKLRDCDLWWKGPEWLVASKTSWPEPFMDFPTTIEEAKCHVVAQDPPLFSDLFVKFSSLSKIQRIVAYCLKFCQHSPCQHKVQEFGRKWRLFYLNTLQQRSRWRNVRDDLVVGEVVLLLDEGNPEGCKWVLGLIEKVRPGRDGHVRVVEVRTKRGMEIPIVPSSLPAHNRFGKEYGIKSNSSHSPQNPFNFNFQQISSENRI
uniref:Peptidase A2 domain-containing protein n=1 Tax=Lutzomyia longipalpis TaxID=7200 RepID=A0A1B0FV44_LUTLO